MRRHIGVIGAVLLLAAGLSVPAATAARHLLVGIQDDAQTVYGNPTATFKTLKELRTQIVRVNLIWGGAPHGVDAADRKRRLADLHSIRVFFRDASVPVVQRREQGFPKTKRMFYHTSSAVVSTTQIAFS